MTEETPIRPAATIVLLRDTDDGFEVLLLRRNSRVPFMPDAYVYPGGALEAGDASVPDSFMETAVDAELSPYLVAAIRECFEEANLLVGVTGQLPVGKERELWRKRLLDDTAGLHEMLQSCELRLDFSRLALFDRWVTPHFESRRFDARFVMARVSRAARALQDDWEVVEAAWMTPEEAFERHYEKALQLFPPTWVTLSWLAQFESADAAMDAARARRVWPIEPHFAQKNDGVVAYFPGSAGYPDTSAPGPGGTLFHLDGCWSFRPDRPEYRWIEREGG